MPDIKIIEEKRFLVFKLDQEEYGIDIHKIITIIENKMNITRVPNTPAYLKGVINLRGEIIPIISLRKKFGIKEEAFTDDIRIIIVKLGEISAGLIVDSVAEVIDFKENETESITNIAGALSLDYISGVGKANGKIITLLNLEKLVSLDDH